MRRTGAPTPRPAGRASPAADGVCCLPLLPRAVYQDDKEEKLKGVKSLIRYATMCEYMLVPTEEKELREFASMYPEDIPQYGRRGWAPPLISP